MRDSHLNSAWIASLLAALFIGLLFVSKLPACQSIDFYILRQIQSLSFSFLTFGFVPFVIVGSIEIGVSGILVFSFWLYRRKEFQKAYLILSALLILTAVEYGMKQIHYHLPVPPEWKGRFPLIPLIGSTHIETNYSFPSGHSLRSLFLFGILFMWWKQRRSFLFFILAYAVLQCIGMNYYGFHWTSDVIGGYLLALIALYSMDGCVKHELSNDSKPHS